MLIQSKLYREYEAQSKLFIKKLDKPIDYPVNLKCTFIVPDRRRRDLANFIEAIQDILVKYKVLLDDNSNIVASLDGSRIIYQKGEGKTIVEIEEVN